MSECVKTERGQGRLCAVSLYPPVLLIDDLVEYLLEIDIESPAAENVDIGMLLFCDHLDFGCGIVESFECN